MSEVSKKVKITGLNLTKKSNFDFLLFFATLLLVAIGVVVVYSSSYYAANITYGDKFFFMKKQIVGAIIGLVAMIFFSFVNYHIFQKLKWVAFVIGLVLLALVFVPVVGVTNYGATRWINLGVTTIQPSEIAKFTFVLFSAAYFAKNVEKVKKFTGILPVVFAGGLTCALIILEPNMSITICVALTMIVMLVVGGARAKHLALLLVPMFAGAVVLVLIEPYRLKRLLAFLDPWSSAQAEGFQLVQSLYALGNGGWFGVGLFNSRQKYLFLPFAESDFIFSIFAEEFGFFGCVLLATVYLVVIIRGLKIAKSATDRFGCYLSTGITAIIAIQFLMNIAVVTGSIPPTGLPLPFISAGSTSLVVFMSAVGILLNINKQSSRAYRSAFCLFLGCYV